MPSVIDRNGDRDGLPTVCMEALYRGLPLICSEVSGLPECVYEGENGFVVPERDAEAIADAMIRSMAQDYEKMSRRSVEVAAELFDSSKNVARIKQIMHQAVNVG
jgi:glycosyltransferase involved in cell wall biosynthesis